MISIVLFFSLGQLIEPATRWQVPFFPVELAALNENHRLFVSTQSEMCVYDLSGNLLLTKPTDGTMAQVTVDPAGGFWILDRDHRLTCLDETLETKWRRQMPEPIFPPRRFGHHMVFVSSHFIELVAPETGQTKIGRYFSQGIANVQMLNPYLLITHQDQSSRSWLPGARVQPLHPLASEPVQFVSPGPDGRLAVLLPGNVLRVYDRKGRRDWERTFNLDVSFAPIWLGSEDDRCLAIITQGRSILIYKKNGLGISRFNMHDRPRALIQCSDNVFLVAMQAEKQVIWYFHRARRFVPQTRSNHLTHLLHNESEVVLIDYDGQVEVFRRSSFSVDATASDKGLGVRDRGAKMENPPRGVEDKESKKILGPAPSK